MNRAILANASISVKLIFSAFVILLVWFVFQFLAIFTGMLLFSFNLEEALNILNNIQDPSVINFIKYVQAITSLGLFIFSSFLIAFFMDTDPAEFLYLRKLPGLKLMLLTLLLILVILPFSNLLTELNGQVKLQGPFENVQKFMEIKESEVETLMRKFLDVKGLWAFSVNILIIVLLPAIGEELLFRGVIQKLLISLTRNAHIGIIISAFIFSALHFQFLSFFPRFILGIIFGYLVFWSNSLWPAIFAHFLNNLLAVIYYHFYYGGKIGNEIEMVGSPGYGLYLGIISMIFAGGIIYLYYKNTGKYDEHYVT